jgi:hypothetical protein
MENSDLGGLLQQVWFEEWNLSKGCRGSEGEGDGFWEASIGGTSLKIGEEAGKGEVPERPG